MVVDSLAFCYLENFPLVYIFFRAMIKCIAKIVQRQIVTNKIIHVLLRIFVSYPQSIEIAFLNLMESGFWF